MCNLQTLTSNCSGLGLGVYGFQESSLTRIIPTPNKSLGLDVFDCYGLGLEVLRN